jgi:hypothetical protein
MLRIVALACVLAVIVLPRPSFAEREGDAGRLAVPVTAALAARLHSLGSLSVEFDQARTYRPTKDVARAAEDFRTKGLLLRTGVWTSAGAFSFLSGRSRYDRRLTGQTLADAVAGKNLHQREEVWTFTPDLAESFLISSRGEPIGAIAAQKPLPGDSYVESGIGLRLLFDDAWLTPERLKGLKITSADADTAVAEIEDLSERLHVLTLDRSHGYALRSDRVYPPHPGPRRDDSPQFIELSNDDFRKVEGITLPFRIRYHNRFTSHKGDVSEDVAEITVKSYRLGGGDNNADRYRILWPARTPILDERTGEQIRTGHTAARLEGSGRGNGGN